MTPATPFPTATPSPAVTTKPPTRRVIDAPTRVFHWLFALCFLGAYLSAEGERWRLLHVTLGYSMAGLLAFRVVYGLLGPRQARLAGLMGKLGGMGPWLRSLTRARALTDVNWRQGQNLLMAAVVVVLMAAVIPVTLTGYASFNDWGGAWLGDWLGELHEAVGEAMLFAVLAHLSVLAALSLWRRSNLATPMLTGRTEGRGPDLAKRNHAWLAVLVVLAVWAYWGWEWQQSPHGLVPVNALSAAARHSGDDD
jgi:cytochrome b